MVAQMFVHVIMSKFDELSWGAQQWEIAIWSIITFPWSLSNSDPMLKIIPTCDQCL